jgi:hypothetical protein
MIAANVHINVPPMVLTGSEAVSELPPSICGGHDQTTIGEVRNHQSESKKPYGPSHIAGRIVNFSFCNMKLKCDYLLVWGSGGTTHTERSLA